MNNMESNRLRDWGITLLRAVIGFVFVMHGWQKWHDMGISGVADGFARMGLPAPMISAILASSAELGGGLLLILGLFTRWAAVPLVITMLVAMLHVHAKRGFFMNTGGMEYVLTLLAASASLVFLGGGPLALDRLLRRRRASAAPATNVGDAAWPTPAGHQAPGAA